jgi:hypothetical protein
MGTKAMQPQTLFPGLTDAISSLFTAKTERPKERAEIFARALEQHLDEYFDQHLIKVLRDNKSAELFLRALEAEAPRATSKHKDIQTSGEIVSAGGGSIKRLQMEINSNKKFLRRMICCPQNRQATALVLNVKP